MRYRGSMSLFGTNSLMSIVRVDSRAMFSSSSLDTSMYVSVSTLYPFVMSSFETSSPVSASTFMYLMRWPVFRLIWLKLIFSASEVAGNKATGQVTSERRKKPFQLARGAIEILHSTELSIQYRRRAKARKVPTNESFTVGAGVSDRCHDILDRAHCFGCRGAPELMLRGDLAGTSPCVRIGTVPHVAVVFAFLNRAGFEQDAQRPSLQGPVR